MTRDEFDTLPVIMDSFPLTFKSGIQRFTHFEIRCNVCKKPVGNELTRGIIERETTFSDPFRGGKSFTRYHVVAHALCCEKLTSATFIFSEDMVVTEVKNGVHYSSKMRKLFLWERFVAFIKGI